MGNALVVHGGAPTAVINASLYGVVDEARREGGVEHFYGAVLGTGGLLKENLLDFNSVSQDELEKLPFTPASAIGTSRDALSEEDYRNIARIVKKHDIRKVFFNGGNGTMEACGKVHQACLELGFNVQVLGIPKTIDNDIAVSDHCPGFGSAARYIAETTREIAADVRSLPIHVCVIEAMGRNAGWLAAASSLAGEPGGLGPDLVYMPELPFDEEEFLDKIQQLRRTQSGIVVVVGEALKNRQGEQIVEPVFKVGRSVYFGDCSAHVANLVTKRLGIKSRSEKPGIAGRCSIAWQSSVDRAEAELAGRQAYRAALEGKSGIMIGFERLSSSPYRVKTIEIPIEQVMLAERTMPRQFINAEGNGVTEEFRQWARPLLGENALRPFAGIL